MQLTTLVTAAGLAVASTNAFLLPPEIASIDSDDIINTLPIPISSDTDFDVSALAAGDKKHLDLDCPGCPVRVVTDWKKNSKDAVQIKTDIPGHLELDFNIEDIDGSDHLFVNDFELYPMLHPFSQRLTARLVSDFKIPANVRGHGVPKNEVKLLGHTYERRLVVKDNDDKLNLYNLRLSINSVDTVFVDSIPTIELTLIETPQGKLVIGSIQTFEAAPSNTPSQSHAECTTTLCRWRAMLKDQLTRFQPFKHCSGERPNSIVGDADEGFRHSGEMHGHHGHGHGHGHGRGPRWGQLFKNIGSHILLPVAIGILAGVTASILGMMAGTLIVYLWRTFIRPSSARRHSRRSHSCRKASRKESAASDEKAGLMVDQEESENPPAYVDEGVTEGVNGQKPEQKPELEA